MMGMIGLTQTPVGKRHTIAKHALLRRGAERSTEGDLPAYLQPATQKSDLISVFKGVAELREAARVTFGLPPSRWMLEVGARLMGTETELLLKSRRVIPQRLVESGFEFRFTDWRDAVRDILRRRG